MRRKLASIAIAGLAGSLLQTSPAGAQNPVDMIISEGIGLVCSKAQLRNPGIAGKNERAAWGEYGPEDYIRTGGTSTTTNPLHFSLKTSSDPGGPAARGAWCNYPGNNNPGGRNPAGTGQTYDLPDPLNYGKTARPDWWNKPPLGSTLWAENIWWPTQTPGNPNSFAQGLFLPGLGPGARGPYSLDITAGTPNPPNNACVSTVGGSGCATRTVGRLTPAPHNGFGAHAGSSEGRGWFEFTSANLSCLNSGELGWFNSAATILPLQGKITAGCNSGRSIVGFTSSRGVSGQAATYGDAGVSLPTNGFQTEAMLVNY